MQTAPTVETEGLRDRILETATRLFANRGFAATSMREIVTAAGCTKPALYYYFTNKEALFREAVAAANRRLDTAERSFDAASSLRAGLLDSLRHVATTVAENPDELRLLFRAQSFASSDSEVVDVRPIRARHLALIEELLRHGIASGEVRADVPVADAAISLVGMLHFELQMYLDGRPLAPDFAQHIVSIYMDGVATNRSPKKDPNR